MSTQRKKHGADAAATKPAAGASKNTAAPIAAPAALTATATATAATPERFDPPSSPSLLAPAVVASFVLTLYLLTVYPSLTGGDSGELLMTTCNLGIAHPPGYPLFTMLGWLWGRVLWPFSTDAHQAYRINCMSAGLGAAAAAMMAATATMLASRTAALTSSGRAAGSSGATLAGVFAAVGFAATPTVWLYSIQSEVFALNNALMAGLLLLTVVYYTREEQVEMQAALLAETKKTDAAPPSAPAAAPVSSVATSIAPAPAAPLTSRSLVPLALGGAFLCGLCLTNQHTTVFPVVVTSAFISWSLWRQGQLSLLRVLQLVAAVLTGMSPYLYLYVRSHWRVIDSWGDQRTLSGFLTHLLRSEYGTFQLAATEISTDPGMRSRLEIYAQNMRVEMMLLTPWLGAVGVVSALCSASRAVRRSALCIALGTLLYVLVFHKLANLDLRPLFLGVQARFWMQSNQALWIFAAVGVTEVASRIAALVGRVSRLPLSAGGALTSVYCLSFLLWHVSRHYPAHNHSSNDSFYVSGRAMLDSFPRDSIVLLNGDLNNNLVKYPQQCEGVRPDVSLLSLQLMSWDWFVPMHRSNYPAVVFPGVRYHVSTPQSFPIRRFLDANIASKKARGGIFLCGALKEGDYSNVRSVADASTGAAASSWYEEHPYGLCSQLLPHGRSPSNVSDFVRRGWSGVARLSALPSYDPVLFGPATWERVLYKDNWSRLLYLFSYAAFHSSQTQTGPDAAPMLALARDLAHEVLTHETMLTQQGHVAAYEYRSMGVIYGMWARQLAANTGAASAAAAGSAAAPPTTHKQLRQAQIDDAHRSMIYSWAQFCIVSPGDSELFPSVRDRVNPYTGQQIPEAVLQADTRTEQLRQQVIKTYAEQAERARMQQQQAKQQQKQQQQQKTKKHKQQTQPQQQPQQKQQKAKPKEKQ